MKGVRYKVEVVRLNNVSLDKDKFAKLRFS